MLIFLKDTEVKISANRRRPFALYRCSFCLKEVEKNKDNVFYQKIDNCGCKPKELKPLPKTISGIEIILDLGMGSESKKRKAIFKCNCGNSFTSTINAVKTKQKLSCGCLKRGGNQTHGLSKHPLYRKWSGMITRTENRNEKCYRWYGKRNIKVCEQWRKDFVSFYEWAISNGYKKGLSIDRIDVDGDYEPNNCQWITISENSSKDRHVTKLKAHKMYEIVNRYQKEHITVTQLAKEYKTYKEAISDMLKENKIEIKQRRVKCYQK